MIRSAVTVCLVPEASRGPFVYHGDLAGACRAAESLGFDAIEIFAPSGHHVAQRDLGPLLEDHGLELAAVGTGAGMVVHGLSLCDANDSGRARACRFAEEIIDFGAPFGAPAVIGSMQGKAAGTQDKQDALGYLAESLYQLATHAADSGQGLVFEPLNRYEQHLLRRQEDGVEIIEKAGSPRGVALLTDFFHMHIEEVDTPATIRKVGPYIGHIHVADNTRVQPGVGDIDWRAGIQALSDVGFAGYLAYECRIAGEPKAALAQSVAFLRETVSSVQGG